MARGGRPGRWHAGVDAGNAGAEGVISVGRNDCGKNQKALTPIAVESKVEICGRTRRAAGNDPYLRRYPPRVVGLGIITGVVTHAGIRPSALSMAFKPASKHFSGAGRMKNDKRSKR